MKRAISFILLGLIVFSCEEVTDWEIQNANLPVLVVDGMITSEKKAHIVRLTLPARELNQPVIPISNATVAISDGDTTFTLTETPPLSGYYLTDSTIRGVYGKTYRLRINYQAKIFTAAANMVPNTPPKPLKIARNSSIEGFYHIIPRDSDEPAMHEYLIDWSQLTEYDTIPPQERKARILQFTLNSIDASEMFKPGKEKVPFPSGTSIISKKYSLSDAHQEFIRTLLSETEWRGGVFDVLPGNVITNIEGGAVGFFSACVVLSDTVSIDPQIHLLEQNK